MTDIERRRAYRVWAWPAVVKDLHTSLDEVLADNPIIKERYMDGAKLSVTVSYRMGDANE